MKFELINPSDPYTFEADNLKVAAVMVCVLGNGAYGAKQIGDDADEGNGVPIFLLGGHDRWFAERFGADFQTIASQAFEQNPDALARCFESVTLQRAERSSMNNIGGEAHRLAARIRHNMAAAVSP